MKKGSAMKGKLSITVPGVLLALVLGSSSASAGFTYEITAMINGTEKKVGFVSHSGSFCDGSPGCNYSLSNFIGGTNEANRVNLEFNFPNPSGPDYEFTEADLVSFSHFNITGVRLNISMNLDRSVGYDLGSDDGNGSDEWKNLGMFENGGLHDVYFYDLELGPSFNGPEFVPNEEPVPTVVPIPAALPLYGSALAFVGITAWRTRRRTNQST